MDGIANPGGGDGVAPTARGQPSGSANTSQQQIEDRDRIAADLNEVVVRRLYSAGLFLQSALALLDGHRAHKNIESALAELDQSIIDIRDTVFGRCRSDSPDGSPPGEPPRPP